MLLIVEKFYGELFVDDIINGRLDGNGRAARGYLRVTLVYEVVDGSVIAVAEIEPESQFIIQPYLFTVCQFEWQF